MGLQETLQTNGEVGASFAAALATVVGGDVQFTIATPAPAVAEVVSDAAARVIVLEFEGTDGSGGSVALIATAALAQTLARNAADEVMVSAAGAALAGAVTSLGRVAGIELVAHPDRANEIPSDAALARFAHESLAFPVLVGDDVVGCLAIHVATRPAEADAPGTTMVFADVEMGVTAELGTAHMTIREFLGLTPGAVIDLDRSVGAPVDLLVNGTAIARGEVVVVDEEFGVRITEILNSNA